MQEHWPPHPGVRMSSSANYACQLVKLDEAQGRLSSIVPKGQLSGSGPTCWWLSHPWSCFSVIINPSSANIGNLLSYISSSSFTYQQDHDKYFTGRFEGGIGGELHKINCHHGVKSIFNHSILLGRNKLLKIPFWPNVQSYGE